MVPVATYGREGLQSVEQRTVAEIIDARLAETFELLQDEIRRAGFGGCFPAGIVLTGGSSQIAGAAILAEEVFGVPARVGVPLRLDGLADTVRGPAFSTSVGLLAWGQEKLAAVEPHPMRLQLNRISGSFKEWLRNFFV